VDPAAQLRALIARPRLLEVPGVYDGLSARLVARAGAEAAYVTGYGAALSRLGLPDAGLLSFKEMADHVAALADAVPLPLIADADTGYGNALNVQRTVRAFERAGAAAIQIEDQVWPKRCGHTAGKQVVPLAEATARVRAALDARARGILVVARTDARAVEGFDRALERCHAFAEAGADLVFCEAPASRDELATLGRAVAAPLLVNLIEGGATPLLPPAELADLGFRVAITPLTLLMVAGAAIEAHLAGHGEVAPRGLPWLHEIAGFPEYDRKLELYR